MIATQHIHPEDLSLHAMRLLDESEAAAVQAHLAVCAECRRAFAEAQDDLALLALTVELATPKASARQRLMDGVAREERVLAGEDTSNAGLDAVTLDPPAARSARPSSTVVPLASRQDRTEEIPVVAPLAANVTEFPRSAARGALLLPWLGWAVAAGASFFAFNEYHQQTALQATVAQQTAQLQVETTRIAALSADSIRARELMETLTSAGALRVTLNTTPAAKALPQGRVSYLPAKGALVFIANNLAPVAPGKVYELWVIPADGSAPVPAGTFSPDTRGSASLVMPDLPKEITAKSFGVTVETEGGASTPTLPILLAGAV